MNFWKLLCGRGCAHQFSWPRIDGTGYHYQICLRCGAAYEYDWTIMRRTRRLIVPSTMVNVLGFAPVGINSPLRREMPNTPGRRS
jgi:hypothetical protein